VKWQADYAHSMQGQALVLGVVLTGLAALVFLRFFAAGQVVAAKSKQTHALDAAAYSGALVQARALNMLSYLNRTHMAHQVAMAHLVTLGSWALFAGNQATQLGRLNPPPHIIGLFFGPAHGAAYLSSRGALGMESMSQQQGRLAMAYRSHGDLVHGLLTRVQNRVVQTLPQVRLNAMHQVLSENFGDTDFELTVLTDTWPGLLQSHSAQPDMAPMLNHLMERFGFLETRNHTARSPIPVDSRCPTWRHELRRRGATKLDSKGHWQAIDTQAFHAIRSNRWILCYFREYPMGWGVADSADHSEINAPYIDNPPENFSSQDFWRWIQAATDWDIFTGKANPLANSYAMGQRPRWTGGGVASYFDLSSQRTGRDATAQFSVQLRRSGPEGLLFATQSAAETYFRRPTPRSDTRSEAPNLFHPYWSARLAAPRPPRQEGRP